MRVYGQKGYLGAAQVNGGVREYKKYPAQEGLITLK